jgi:hypothetical protein
MEMCQCSARRALLIAAIAAAASGLAGAPAFAQSLGGAGTVQGTVKDQSGGVLVGVVVDITNPVSGLTRETTTDKAGTFVFHNLPQNPYHLTVTLEGFTTIERDVEVRSAVAVDTGTLTMKVGQSEKVTVTAHAEDLIEKDPVAHVDLDQSRVAKLPVEATSGLNQAITLASPGVVADSNGFFHPIGDHAQTQFSIDNQPVTDQQSRVYSNQISPDAVSSMEVITGVPPAEFGDKDSLVVRVTTKSGLDQGLFGSTTVGYGSFHNPTGEINIGGGSHTMGNFLSYQGLVTDRYLDPPEFAAINDHGLSNSVFDRLDAKAGPGTFHLNVEGARSSFDVPDSDDQQASGQAQHQTINTFNFAPGYSSVLGQRGVLTANGYVRQDRVAYLPSADPFADTPATMSQNRRLTNFGGKVDVSYLHGAHNMKVGGEVGATRLTEAFSLGLTDPTFNSPCVGGDGTPSGDTSLTATTQCAAKGLTANDAFIPGLLPYDLSRGGADFLFNSHATIKQQAVYAQDQIDAGPTTLNLGVRFDHYDGLTQKSLFEPRLGIAFQPRGSSTIVRASYGRTMETPYNENLLLSSSTGTNGLADSVFGANSEQPLQPGVRDQFETGIQQGLGSWISVDVGYFKKHTHNGYDFDVLFDTPIVFPISWDHSDLHGITGRVNLIEHKGFSAFTVFGHNVARFFNPENGGILFDSPLPSGAFRIDHDQKFQQTTNLQYTFDKAHGVWAAMTWRYDSGLVAGDVPDYATALTLDGDQQAAIGLYCGSTFATVSAPITSCGSTVRGATRLVIPADGTENDDTNPPRIASRNVFDLGFGADNLNGGARTKIKVRVSVINLMNKEALYNFLSTFSGTHFFTPRAYQLQVGVTF